MRTRNIKTLLLSLAAAGSLFAVTGCAYYYDDGYYYGGRYDDGYYGPYNPYVYYDGYYGPYYGGYWSGATFYWHDGRRYRRGDGHHFRPHHFPGARWYRSDRGPRHWQRSRRR